MKERTWRKRAVAWVLAGLMVLSMIPVALAVEGYLDESVLEFIEDDTVRWTTEREVDEAIEPMSPHWYLPITQEVVDALNDRDSAAFGVIPIGAADGSVPNFELVAGPGIRVYNRMNSYHGLDVFLDHQDPDIDPADRFNPTPGTLYTLTVVGQVSGGGVFRTLFPLNEAGGWETGGSNGSGTTHTLAFSSEPPMPANLGADGHVGRITTNCQWTPTPTLMNDFVITSLTITSPPPPPVNVIYSLRADSQFQEYLAAGASVTGFTAGLLALSGNPVITVAHDAAVANPNFPDVTGLYYLHVAGGRAADYYAIRVGGVGEGIEGTLAAGNVITVRGRIDGAPAGVVMAIDYAAAPYSQGASAAVAETNGHFVLSHIVTAANVTGGLNIRTRAGGEAVAFYIYDIAITNRTLFGDEVDIYLGAIPGAAPPPPAGLTAEQVTALLEAAISDVEDSIPLSLTLQPGETADAQFAVIASLISDAMEDHPYVIAEPGIFLDGVYIVVDIIFAIAPDVELAPGVTDFVHGLVVHVRIVEPGSPEYFVFNALEDLEDLTDDVTFEGIGTGIPTLDDVIAVLNALVASLLAVADNVIAVIDPASVEILAPAFPYPGLVSATIEVTYAGTGGASVITPAAAIVGASFSQTFEFEYVLSPAYDLTGAAAVVTAGIGAFPASNTTTAANVVTFVEGLLGPAGADIVVTVPAANFNLTLATVDDPGALTASIVLAFAGETATVPLTSDWQPLPAGPPSGPVGPGPDPGPGPGQDPGPGHGHGQVTRRVAPRVVNFGFVGSGTRHPRIPSHERSVSQIPRLVTDVETPEPATISDAPPPIPAPVPAPGAVAPIDWPAAAGRELLQLNVGNNTYFINGVSRVLSDAPTIVNNRTMVPFRFVGETLGVDVAWDGDTRTASYIRNGATVASVTIDVPLPGDMGTPMIINNRTFVPFRFIAEALGADVEWLPDQRAVLVIFGEAAPVFEIPEIEIEIDDEDEDEDEDEYVHDSDACDDEDCEYCADEYEHDRDACDDEDCEYCADDEDENGDAANGEANGYVLRHTHGENWGQVVLEFDFSDDDYTITLEVLHESAAGEFGVDPGYMVDGSWNFQDNGGVLESTRAESPAGTWNEHTFTFPGAIANQVATSSIQIGTAYPRVRGSSFYIDNVVVTNSAGTVVFSNDFETNLNGFTIRSYSEDTQARVPMP